MLTLRVEHMLPGYMTTHCCLPRGCTPLVGMIATLFTIGCTNPFGNGDCSAVGVAGISATVIDANTNRAPVAVPSMRIEDGTYVEEYTTPFPKSDPPGYSGAIERPGTYRVLVRAAGYQDYVIENVRITRAGRCNYLAGGRLTVSLVRTP